MEYFELYVKYIDAKWFNDVEHTSQVLVGEKNKLSVETAIKIAEAYIEIEYPNFKNVRVSDTDDRTSSELVECEGNYYSKIIFVPREFNFTSSFGLKRYDVNSDIYYKSKKLSFEEVFFHNIGCGRNGKIYAHNESEAFEIATEVYHGDIEPYKLIKVNPEEKEIVFFDGEEEYTERFTITFLE